MKRIISIIALMTVCSIVQAAPMTLGPVTDLGGGSYTLTTAGSAPTDAAVETFLGLTAGILDSISTGNATAGAALKDTFAISTGQVFSFDWTWSSSEGGSGPVCCTSINDFSFVSLSLDGIQILADAFDPDPTTSTFSWTATTTGLLTYGIGIMDLGDTVVDSSLTVSNISLVPEPATLILFFLGLAGIGSQRRRTAS